MGLIQQNRDVRQRRAADAADGLAQFLLISLSMNAPKSASLVP